MHYFYAPYANQDCTVKGHADKRGFVIQRSCDL